MYDADRIAAYTINWCHDHNITITNLKLQKLLYFLQGNYYRQTHQRLIDDDFFAWQLGPVIPKIYSKYAIYSASSIPRQNDVFIDAGAQSCMGQILKVYAPLSAWQLVDLSHREDPWKYNYQIFGDKTQIPYISIVDFYGGNIKHDS